MFRWWCLLVFLQSGYVFCDVLQERMSFIPGGTIVLGTKTPIFPQDGEDLTRTVYVEDFYMDQFEVSVSDFSKFVRQTSYVTDAERFGWSFVHELALSSEVLATVENAVQGAPWWLPVPNATWQHPEGVGSTVVGRETNAVNHVSFNDAVAFCHWRGARLPTEAEWEHAARGGKQDRLFPWGNLETPKGKHRCNIWQGKFPYDNSAEDGFKWVAPVDSFGPQNKFNLYNMAGNVWEWVGTAWCDRKRPAPFCRQHVNTDDLDPLRDNPEYVKKGGSFMCHKDHCYRYRIAARSQNTADSSAYNLGFRCAKSGSTSETEL